MSANHRELLPAPSSYRQRQTELQSSQRRPGKRRYVTAACKGCQEKKTKCSGERPTCDKCRLRLMECIYDRLPGETWSTLRKSKSERLEKDLGTMMELYWYLRTQSKEDAAKTLDAIQSGMDPSQIMEALNHGGKSHDALSNPMDKQGDDELDANALVRDLPGCDAQNGPTTAHGDESPQGNTSESNRETESNSPGKHLSMLDPSQIINALESGVEAFLSCTGCIFHIYERDEAQDMLDVVRPCIREAGELWPQLIFRGSAPIRLKVSLCSVCIMAAIGLQYTKDPIPALGIEPSVENGTYQYVTVFYEFAKHLMEAVVENDVLEAIKVCAAMCVFNTIGHATIALAHADMGINFALTLGPSFQYCPAGLSHAAWVNYKRVARTLVTLRAWLITTLGYVPGDNPGLRASIHWLIGQEDLNPNEAIQQELVKVVEIEANLLRTVDSFRSISPLVFSSTRRDLVQWREQLPQWMKINALVESCELSTGTRRTVFLVHLFYLSAYILAARLAHGGQSTPLSHYDVEEVRIAAGDGVLAARTASRILQLQLDEQAIFQRCWLYEFTAYMSAIVLLHSAAQLLLHSSPQPVWQKELSYAKSCLDVLEYCGSVDTVAQRFNDATRGFYDTLQAEAQQEADFPASDLSETFEHLFVIPESSPPHLGRVSRDLLELISRPFGCPSNLHTEGMLKAGFGSQREWNLFVTLPFKKAAPEALSSLPLLSIALSGMQSGQFLGSSQPHRWDALLNPSNL